MKDNTKALILLGGVVATDTYHLNHLKFESAAKEITITEEKNNVAEITDYLLPHFYKLTVRENSTGNVSACIDFKANQLYAEYNPFWARDYATGEASEDTSFSEVWSNYELNGRFGMWVYPQKITGEICLEKH